MIDFREVFQLSFQVEKYSSVKSKEGIARGFYCTLVGKRIVMLHIFIKKSNRIPKKELIIAIRRMNEVIEK